MSDILRFIWIAFVEYWGAWVTGTGIVGLLLWLLSFAQTLTGWKLKLRHYLIILFCVFWFVATYAAWRDADKNLSQVIKQRAVDVSDLGKCRGEFTAKSQLLEQAQARLAQQQLGINNQQNSLNAQQGTINRCVVSLGKMNPIVNSKITTLAMPVTNVSEPGRFGFRKTGHLFEIVILTNLTRGPRGILKCADPFKVIDTPSLKTEAEAAMTVSGPPTQITDREYSIWVQNTGASWNPDNPIYLPALSDSTELHGCTFTPAD
jgi:hypothetical protein